MYIWTEHKENVILLLAPRVWSGCLWFFRLIFWKSAHPALDYEFCIEFALFSHVHIICLIRASQILLPQIWLGPISIEFQDCSPKVYCVQFLVWRRFSPFVQMPFFPGPNNSNYSFRVLVKTRVWHFGVNTGLETGPRPFCSRKRSRDRVSSLSDKNIVTFHYQTLTLHQYSRLAGNRVTVMCSCQIILCTQVCEP